MGALKLCTVEFLTSNYKLKVFNYTLFLWKEIIIQMLINVVLVWYISECTVAITNINNGIKEPMCGYQNCDTSRTLILDGFVIAREYHSKSYHKHENNNIWVAYYLRLFR